MSTAVVGEFRPPPEKVSLIRSQAVTWLNCGLADPNGPKKKTSPALQPLELESDSQPPASLQKLNPVDEENSKVVLGILHELAAGDASLDDLSSMTSAKKKSSTSNADDRRKEWSKVAAKLFALRSQISNPEILDTCVNSILGNEAWTAIVREAPANLMPAAAEDDNGEPVAQDGDSSPPPKTLVAIGDSPPSESLEGRRPGSPPAPADEDSDGKGVGGPSPIGHAANAGFPSTPPLNPETPEFVPASQRLNGSTSTPPSVRPPRESSTSSAAASPTVRAYHLESREEMISRHQRNRNGSFGSASMGGSTTAFTSTPPPQNLGTPPMGPQSGPRTPSNSPMLGPSMMSPLMQHMHHQQILNGLPPAQPNCQWDYILVIDFEATCNEPNPPNFIHEIIEFPVVVVEVSTLNVVAEFQSYVRPVKNPTLSPFCVNLTGIQQRDVDHAPVLQDVVDKFERWFKNTIPTGSRCVIATDGPWDMRDFMFNYSVRLCGVTFPQLFYQWVDIKATFASFFGCQRGKIRPMLEALGLSFEGRLHSGIDDARNIANIVVGLLQRGCALEVVDSISYTGPPASIDD